MILKIELPIRLLLPVLLLQLLAAGNCAAQITLSGTVYDSTRVYGVPGVIVSGASGNKAITDSLGAYHINVTKDDSISFAYRGKSTQKFPVATIDDYSSFDISLWVRIDSKYKVLKGVTVYADTYQQDSIENRMEYSKIFDYEKPGLSSTYDPGGAAGIDLDALINAFNHAKNKENLAFHKRLIEEEQDHYVKYRFNARLVRRITGLSGDTLKKFMQLYMPSYDFIANSTLIQFYQYILNASYAFKREEGIPLN
ncbi:MAG TPA: hypothetical protein VG847_02460 [Chitinophagaceae bacterium]|nr:hypothetical protein [Chitinophagaceae bacterium]